MRPVAIIDRSIVTAAILPEKAIIGRKFNLNLRHFRGAVSNRPTSRQLDRVKHRLGIRQMSVWLYQFLRQSHGKFRLLNLFKHPVKIPREMAQDFHPEFT